MLNHRLLALAFGFTGLTLSTLALAQSWQGSEAIGVQATDSKGKPIAGARVVLSFQARGAEGSPPEVATDQKGKAVIAGLATGSWQIEVQHPEFLSYVAVFDLDRDKKPSVNASFLEASGSSLTPMKVKLSKGNPRDASSPLPSRIAATELPPRTEPDRAAAEPSAEPAPPAIGTAAPVEPAVVDQAVPPEMAQAPVQEKEMPAQTPTPPPQPAPDQQPAERQVPQPEEEQAALPAAPVAGASTEPSVETTIPDREPEVATEPRLEPSGQPAAAPTSPPPTPEPTRPEAAQPETPSVATPILEERLEPEPIEAEPEPVQSEPQPAEIRSEPTAPPAAEVDQPSQATAQETLPEPTTLPITEPEEEVPRMTGIESPTVEVAPTPEPPAVSAAASQRPAAITGISSYRDGSCSECRTGEWAVTAAQEVATGTAPCPAGVEGTIRPAADLLGASMQLELSGYVGPVAEASSGDALAVAETEISQAVRQQLADRLGTTNSCRVVAVVLPKSVRFAGFRFEAFDERGGGGECTLDGGCPLPGARWLANPVVQRGPSATVVWALFENTTTEGSRLAQLKVYFRPPNASWQPPSR
jgi:hypothetical protein